MSAYPSTTFAADRPTSPVVGIPVEIDKQTPTKKRKLEAIPTQKAPVPLTSSENSSSRASSTSTSHSSKEAREPQPPNTEPEVEQKKEAPTIVTPTKCKQVSLLLPTRPDWEAKIDVASGKPVLSKKAVRIECCVCNEYGDRHPAIWTRCRGCEINVHKRCTRTWTPSLGPWLCKKCHICFRCEEEFDEGEDFQTCSTCYVSVHDACEGDRLKKAATWRCPSCKESHSRPRIIAQAQPIRSVEVAAVSLPAPAVDEKPTDHINGGDVIPDASKWTARDVYEYFVKRFPTEATAFQEQEIDGISLLLMRRSDVIQGLGFKLGPALRIYKQIIMLQTRDPDPTLTWY